MPFTLPSHKTVRNIKLAIAYVFVTCATFLNFDAFLLTFGELFRELLGNFFGTVSTPFGNFLGTCTNTKKHITFYWLHYLFQV